MLVSKIKEIKNGRVITKDAKTKDINLLPEEIIRIVMKKAGVTKSVAERAVSKLLSGGEVSAGLSEADILKKAKPFLPAKDAIDPTKPKNIAAAKNLSKAQGQAASDGGPGSGQKGHKSAHIPDPSTHKERRKERANLQKYIENARRSGNIKEAQKHSQRLAHINSLSLNS